MKSKILAATFSLFSLSIMIGQPVEKNNMHLPEIGRPCPDFELNDIRYFNKTKATLQDFTGQWLLLDFFTTGCAVCFQNMPKMKQLQQEFSGQIQFMYVGLNDGKLPKSYEAYRAKFDLHFPVAYDSGRIVFDKFGIFGVPHIVLINKDGIVKAITAKIAKEQLLAFLSGSEPNFVRKPYEAEYLASEKRYDPRKPLLIDNNGGEDSEFLFRSVLAPYRGDIYAPGITHITNEKSFSNPAADREPRIVIKGRVQIIGYPISELYRLAYGDTISIYMFDSLNSYGKWWPRPILEVTDSSEFAYDYDVSNENLYNYSLTVPPEKSTAQFLQQAMQRDLQTYFNYSVSVETRPMPCWSITVSNDWHYGKRKPQVNQKKYPARTSIKIEDQPISFLIAQLFLKFQDQLPFIDDSGYSGHISFRIESLSGDFEGTMQELRKHGVYLTKVFKPMKVVVIKDAK